MLLSQEFSEIGSKVQALQKCGGDQVEGLLALASSLSAASGVVVRKVEASDDGA